MIYIFVVFILEAFESSKNGACCVAGHSVKHSVPACGGLFKKGFICLRLI